MLLSLDLSTSTGWALFDGKILIDYGTVVHKAVGRNQSQSYPYNMIDAANFIAKDIDFIIMNNINDISSIAIEESNIGLKDRFSAKQSEFIHYAICSLIRKYKIQIDYIDTSKWQKAIKIKFTPEQKLHNKMVKEKKAKVKITKKRLTLEKVNKMYGLNLLMKDNDISDAIAVGSSYLINIGIANASEWEQ